ncbi:MAG: hypothetical protein GVY17_03360 [Cyanobacteria bacterium]|nr:hypothetical protein [Cyanobacteria bacterium GSL.Bin21]
MPLSRDDKTDVPRKQNPGTIANNHDDIFGSQLRLQGFYRDTDNFFGSSPFEDTFTGDFPGSPIASESEFENFGGRLEIETPISETFNLLWGVDDDGIARPVRAPERIYGVIIIS